MAASGEEYSEHDVSMPENSDIKQEQQHDDNLGGVGELHHDNDSGGLGKQQPDDDSGGVGVDKKWPGWPGESVFRMLVPGHTVGGIIGRKGEFIKRICEETRARIKILEGPPGAQERAVLISAREEPDTPLPPAIDALLRVYKRSVDGLDADLSNAPPSSAGTVSSRLLAGATQAGSLIGKQGTIIKSIQEASNCIIRVHGQEDLPVFALEDDRIVVIQGESPAVHKAIGLVASHLRKFLVDRSIIGLFEMEMQNPRPQMDHNIPPHHPWGPPDFPQNAGGGPGFGPHNSGLAPGFGPQNFGGAPGFGPQDPSNGPGFGPQYPSSGYEYGPNPYMGPPRQPDNYYPPADLPPMEKQPHQGLSMYGRDASMGVHSSTNAQPPQAVFTQVSQNMQVPLSYADAVIGNAGANISYIRRASGATITIQETRGVPGEMTVEINGSASQVQAAQQLIQNYMAEAASSQQNPTNGPAEKSYPAHGNMYTSPPSNIGHAGQNAGSYGSNYNAYGNNYGPNYGY